MTPGLAEQATLNVLYAMWWGPTLSYFMDLREQWANEREALVAEYVRVELASMQQGELVHRLQEELDAEVEHELTPAKTHLHSLRREFQDGYSNDSGTRTTDWDAAARLLRGTAEHSVRPLSRKLLHQEQTTYPMMRWWMVLVNVVQSQPFRPLPFAVIDILGTFSAQIRTFGLMRGLLLLFGGLAWTILLMTIANAFMRRFPHRHSAIFIGAIIALQSTVFLRGHFRELWVPGSAEASWTITQIVAGIVVIFVTSGFGAWWSQRLAARDIVRDEIRIDRVRAMARSQQIAILARETSQVLHGSVQTRLVSCAMGIEQASATGNVELLSAALTEAIAVLDRPEEESVQTGSLADEVSRKLALWDGLCAFTVTLDPAAFTAPPNSSIVIGRVVEEGIANAIRHGKASEIEVGVARIDGETIQVVVSDNGRGPGGGTPGLGSAYLQQASAHRWSLTFDGQQTHLCVLVTA
jgi:signal transduction histidine kinase